MANEVIRTPEFRVSYPNVFRPRENDDGQLKYGLAMLFPKGADLSKLKAAAAAAAREKWHDKIPKGLRTPFRDQGEKETEGYEPGAIFINATSKQRPGLVDRAVMPITDETDFYAGCYAVATVRAYAYDQKGNRGVAFGLNNVQKTRDGEPLGGRTRPTDDFEPLEAAAADALFDDALDEPPF